jgi:hypothetical protein
MSAGKHTVGQWTVLDNRGNPYDKGCVHVIADGSLNVATIAYQLPDANGETERMANASLISAAKEMLKALCMLIDAAPEIKAASDEELRDALTDDDKECQEQAAAFLAARAAIAKATGAPRFADVTCSHCAKSFGPGNAGFSHCEDHAHLVGRPA